MEGVNQKIICITGMERSGTSMIARILNYMGVYLGPKEKLILETDYNVKGCWEHKPLLDISDAILQRFGGDTHNPPVFPSRWENDPRISDLEVQARQIIQEDFGNKDIWGWKDTRCCITLPFWQKLFPEMVSVVCLRNPLDVAKSLAGKSLESSILNSANLWLIYNASVIKHTHNKRRIFVFYDDFFTDWRSEVKRLVNFLGPLYMDNISKVEPEIEAFIEKKLKHFKTSLLDTLNNPDIHFSTKAFYLTLIQLAKIEDQVFLKETMDVRSWQVIDAFAHYADRDASTIFRLKRALEKKENQLAEKDRQIDNLLNSYSWKITAPLRGVFKLLRKATS